MAHFGESGKKSNLTYETVLGASAVFLAVFLLLSPVGRPLFALIAVLLLPGLAWAGSCWLWQDERLRWESIGLSLAGALAIVLIGVLGLAYVPQEISRVSLILLVLAFTLLPLGIDYARGYFPRLRPPSFKIEHWLWLLPLAVALILRLPWFGYREIQGDEGVVLVRAADALMGDTAELLLHRKGPMEILLTMSVWGTVGTLNDFWSRLPFLLCNLLSLALFYRLVERWFGRNVAVVGTTLLGMMGFHVAFSRVVQYQSLVMMWGIGAMLAADRYRTAGRTADLLLTAVLLAAGLLSHYDAVLFAPAIVALLVGRWIAEKAIPLKQLMWPMSAGAVMLGAFYLPFVLGPDFQNAVGYLLNERVDTGSGGSSADVWQMITFYNSTWYILGLIGFAVTGAVAIFWKRTDWAIKLSAGLLCIVPLFFYTVIVSVARTHVYTFFPGLIVLAAVGINWIADMRRPTPWLFWLGWSGFTIWFLVCASYVFLLFTWGPGEVQRNWETRRPNPTIYPTTWETPPDFGLFGFPYRAGWREIGRNDFAGLVYASNEEAEITSWYMAQAQRTHCDEADLFFFAENVQDEIVFSPQLLAGKAESAVGGGLTLFHHANFVPELGGRMVTQAEIAKPRFGGETLLDVPLGERTTLLGYDLIPLENGNGVEVVLYWHAEQPFARNFQAFVHALGPDGKIVTQFDSAPECGINPTTRWEPGTVIRDPHKIEFPADWPAEQPLRLVAGMYDLITFERLPVADEPDNFVPLTEIRP